MSLLLAALLLAPAEPVFHESRAVLVGSRRVKAEVVSVRLSQVRIKVGLAQDRVGPTEALATLAKRKGALAAINGSFFDAYADRPIKCPHHTVMTDGEVVHLGNVGSLVGFRGDGSGVIGRLDLRIEGLREGSNDWAHKWYAYWINRYPTSNTVTIFTRYWGSATGFDGARQILVKNGKVTWIEQASQPIPASGFVIYQRGVADSSFNRIQMGSQLSYRLLNKNTADGDWGGFSGVREAIGAGPTLLRNGLISVDSVGEGFADPKILTHAGARSAVGLTADGRLLLVATNGTIQEVAQLMKSLGCRDAMNLDGGASSGLIFNGTALRTPGRAISNALLVLPK